MRYFFRTHIPPFRRVLLIESGSRHLYEEMLPGIFEHHGPETEVDLVTCFAGEPQNFRGGRVWRVYEYQGRAARKRLYRELEARNYDIVGIICAGEPVMTKWKWVLAARLPAKVIVLNENGDYFWLDRSNLKTIRHFILFRAGLSGAGAVETLFRLALFPFTLLYLISFAAYIHLRRKARA